MKGGKEGRKKIQERRKLIFIVHCSPLCGKIYFENFNLLIEEGGSFPG